MRSDLVEEQPPMLDDDRGFDAMSIPLHAQSLVPTLPVERFVGAILPRLAAWGVAVFSDGLGPRRPP